MQLFYKLTEEDYSRFLYHRVRFSYFHKAQARFGYAFLAFGLILLLGYYGRYDLGAIIESPFFGGLICFFYTLILIKGAIHNYKMEIKEYRINEFIGERSLTLDDHHIVEKADGIIIITPYEKLYKIDYYNRYFFIYYDALSGAIVPFSAFVNQSDLAEFIDILKNKRPDLRKR